MLAYPAPLPQQRVHPYLALMQMRTRKLIGTVVLLVFLGAYAWAAVIIGAGRITLASHWAQLGYFLTAGLLWVIPAALLIRWMQRPDAASTAPKRR
jgi:Protein of unknown function (DUF2842)